MTVREMCLWMELDGQCVESRDGTKSESSLHSMCREREPIGVGLRWLCQLYVLTSVNVRI